MALVFTLGGVESINFSSRSFMTVNSSCYFQTLVIAAPVFVTPNTGNLIGSSAGDCATDSFSVTAGGGGRSSPIICGRNTGQHGEYRARDLRLM